MKLSTVAFFLLGLLGGGAAVYFLYPRPEPAAQSTFVPRGTRSMRAASALGRIQPYDGVISVGNILPDRLARLHCEEGREVKRGDVLVELASQVDRKLDLNLLDQQIKEAQARLRVIEESGALQDALNKLQIQELEEQGPLEISMQKLKVDFLKKQATQAREGLARIASLPSVSKQEKDQQELAALQSQTEFSAAQEQLAKLTLAQASTLKIAQTKIDLAAATRERNRAEVPLATLKQQRTMALHRLQETSLKAPAPGRVLRIFAHPGELVGPTEPILQLADVSKMAVLAEVYETDIHNVFPGQHVDITSKVETAQKLTGTVVSIGALIGKNRVYDADPLADVDRRVIEVKILLDQPDLAAALINLQVNVDFKPRQ